MRYYNFFRLLLILILFSLSGCREASFDLADESRLPMWFAVPEDKSRVEYKVTMDYYVYPEKRFAVFKLYKDGGFFPVKKVKGNLVGKRPLVRKEQSSSSSKYPSYEIITVDGTTELVEHRKMEPVFYITDDPAVWEELGVK